MYRLDHLTFHLHRLGIDLVLDVGANTGQFARELRANGYRGTIISFEPLSAAHTELERSASGDPLWQIASRMAVGATSGHATINVSANSYSSSLLPMLANHLDAAPGSAYVGTEQVDVVRLSDYLRQTYPDGVPAFALKIDTQGFEGEVLEGVADLLGRCNVALVEMPLQELYGGAADLPAIYQRLAQAGLRCVGMSPGHHHPVSRDAVEIDGLFVRYDVDKAVPIADMAFCLFTSIPPLMSRLGADGATEVGPEYQRQCVQSWLRAGFKVISVNPAAEATAVAAMGLPIDVMSTDGTGRPTIADFAAAIGKRRAELCGIINADCQMLDYPDIALALRAGASDGIVIAERMDLVDGQQPVPGLTGGFDLFLFPARSLEKLETVRFAIGDPVWDHWFPVALAASGLAVRNLTTPLITHHKHAVAWDDRRWRENFQLFWSDLRRWRAASPAALSHLDDEIARLWDVEILDPAQTKVVARRIYRWLHGQQWDPGGGVADGSPGLIPTLVRALRTESLLAARLRADANRLRSDLAQSQAAVRKLGATNREQERVLKEIKSSVAWRLTKPIRVIAKAMHSGPKQPSNLAPPGPDSADRLPVGSDRKD